MLSTMIQAKKSSNWGGAREGSGRPPQLSEDAKPCQVILEPKHFRVLERYAKTVNASNRSEALRALLDQVATDYELKR